MFREMREETNKRLSKIKPVRREKSITHAVVKFQSEKKSLPWKTLAERRKIKIKNVKDLQNGIARRYTEIMAFISRDHGTPPCEYALIGMGSLARKEISSYSDFQHIIALEELLHVQNPQDILEYFRWYSVIFHIIAINLQETIIPCVWIRSLNDNSKLHGNCFFDRITTRGISFDGMMPHACKFPLGRTQKTAKKPWKSELIKPVSEMVEYLDYDQDLKNGYH